MANTSKCRQIAVLAIFLISSAVTAFGQDYWSVQKPMSCHPKLLSSVHGGVFQPQVKQYEWQGRVTNTYDQTVTFDMYMKVGNQKITIGQFTVEPGKSTNATSRYYDDASKIVEISVDHVCFLEGGCKTTCYAGCDDGRSINQPSCDVQSNNPSSTQNKYPTNAGPSTGPEGLKQKILANLREHGNRVTPDSTVKQEELYIEVEVDSDGKAILWKTGTVDRRFEYSATIPLENLAKSRFYPETTYPQFGKLVVGGRNCVSKSPSGSGSWCYSIDYDAGPDNRDLNELQALAAQLAGVPSPPKSASNAPNNLSAASGNGGASNGGTGSTVSGTCQSGLDQLEREFSGINARKPAGISTIPLLQTGMYMVAKMMDHLQNNCQGQPQYSQYAEYKKTYDSLLANCNAIATTPSVCVAQLSW